MVHVRLDLNLLLALVGKWLEQVFEVVHGLMEAEHDPPDLVKYELLLALLLLFELELHNLPLILSVTFLVAELQHLDHLVLSGFGRVIQQVNQDSDGD